MSWLIPDRSHISKPVVKRPNPPFPSLLVFWLYTVRSSLPYLRWWSHLWCGRLLIQSRRPLCPDTTVQRFNPASESFWTLKCFPSSCFWYSIYFKLPQAVKSCTIQWQRCAFSRKNEIETKIIQQLQILHIWQLNFRFVLGAQSTYSYSICLRTFLFRRCVQTCIGFWVSLCISGSRRSQRADIVYREIMQNFD